MKKSNVFHLVLVVIAPLVSWFYYDKLPDLVPMHWNVRGEIDNWMPKDVAVWLWPVLVGGMWLLFIILPRVDPKKEKYAQFRREWDIMQTIFLGLFIYLQIITFHIALHPDVSLMPLMFIGLGTFFVLMGNYLSKIRQNYFLGIKLPWTLANEDNWNKTHRFASWCFVILGIIIFIEAYAIWYAPVVIFGSILLAIMLPVIYSFLLFKKKLQFMKYVYIGLIVLILSVTGLRLLSNEDDWICSNGSWIRHGNPRAPIPVVPCP